MNLISNYKHLLIFLGVTVTPLIIEYYFKKRNRKLTSKTQVDNSEYNCLFVTLKNYKCKEHIYHKTPCNQTCSYHILQKIVEYIKSAKYSICMCMYILTAHDVALALIELHQNNVQIRVITDREMARNLQSRVDLLKSKGIQVKIQPNGAGLMHHKFCLLDEQTPQRKMFIGSLNLTLQAITANFDDMVFTNNQRTITQFSDDFENMWNSFAFV